MSDPLCAFPNWQWAVPTRHSNEREITRLLKFRIRELGRRITLKLGSELKPKKENQDRKQVAGGHKL